MWKRCAGDMPETVDNYTVSKLTSLDPEQVGAGDIKNIFYPKESTPPVFPGMDDESKRKLACQTVLHYQSKGRPMRSLKSLATDSRKTLLRFYNVIEQIPIWFDKDASRGYQGGGSISNRPRVETTLITKFGKAGYAAIMAYVIKNWERMYEVGKGISCNDKKYPGRFSYRVWYDLGLTLFVRWKAVPIFEHYLPAFNSITQFMVLIIIIIRF